MVLGSSNSPSLICGEGEGRKGKELIDVTGLRWGR
jgi:hypothetical protein